MHDRTTIAWLVLGCYLASAIAAVWAGRVSQGADRRFWFGAAALLVVLGLAKRFKLQDWLTGAGRSLARMDGLYEYRRLGQTVFVFALAIFAALVAIALRHWFNRAATPVKTAVLALVLLLSFVIIRATSIHAVDQWVTAEFGGIRAGWWLELAGIAALAMSAISFARTRSAQQSP